MLKSLSSREEITNCVIFVADSYRYDCLSDTIADLGVGGKTISPSTFTAPSLPSLLSGHYPLSHSVWDFDDQLPTLPLPYQEFETAGWSADTVWGHIDDPTDKPPYKMLNLDTHKSLPDLSPPFFYAEHHRGGHIPYGDGNTRNMFDHYDSTEDFCNAFAGRPNELREQYRKGTQSAETRFSQLLTELRDRDILDETLVIFTSDHGEVLGEYGTYTHGAPMIPEVVTVPTVFIGAGLESGETDQLLSGVDLVPTALGATNKSIPRNLPGSNLWDSTPDTGRIVYSHQWQPGRFGYEAAGAWRKSGGRIKHYGSRLRRLPRPITQLIRGPVAPLIRSQLPWSLVKSVMVYTKQHLTYGESPPGKSVLPARSEFSEGHSIDGINQTTEEQLRMMGYMN